MRKKIELALRTLPPPIRMLNLNAEAVPIPLRVAMIRAAPVLPLGYIDPAGHISLGESLLVAGDDDSARTVHAAALIKGGALLDRLTFALREEGEAAVIGFAELILVRAPPPAAVNISPCRICWGEEDGDVLDPAVAEAAAAASIVQRHHAAAHDLAEGLLLHDVCGCRGSSSSVHEGCLVTFLCMNTDSTIGMSLTELKCVTCKQPFVGRASHLLSRCAAAVRAARAAQDEAAAAEAEALADNDVAGAAELAEEAALAAAEGRANEATALWRSGSFELALERFLALVETLREMRPIADPMRALRKALLQHSTEHNLGLIMISYQNGQGSLEKRRQVREQAQPLVSAALAGFEDIFGTAHPKFLHAMHTMGLLAAEAESHEEAANCFRTAYDGRMAHVDVGPDKHDTLRSAVAYGKALNELKRHADALAFIEEVEARAGRVLGGESPMTLIAAHVRALALAGVGRRPDACGLLRRVHGSRVMVLGERHQETLTTASDLGELLGKAQSTRLEARALLRVAAAAMAQTLGATHRLAELAQSRLEHVEDAIARGAGDEALDDDTGAEAGGEVVAVLLHVFVNHAERRRGVARAALPELAATAWEAGADALEALVPCEAAQHAEGTALLDVMLNEMRFERRGEPLNLNGLAHAHVRLERPVELRKKPRVSDEQLEALSMC